MQPRSLPRIALCDGITFRVPVVQAPLGYCDNPTLAAEVSRAGALGTLTVHAPTADSLRRHLQRIRARTPRPVLLAFTAEWERETVLQTCLDAGFRHFHVFWWNGPRLAPRIQAAGGTVFWRVGTRGQAQDALDAGADVLIASATEGGGQVRSPRPLTELITEVQEVMAASRTVPLVAGGGLADRHDVAAVLAQGATAALLGTRFLLSEEASAPPRHKAALARADSTSLILDPRLVGDWPCSPRRRLVTTRGEDRFSLYAGLGLGRMNQISPAGELVAALAL